MCLNFLNKGKSAAVMCVVRVMRRLLRLRSICEATSLFRLRQSMVVLSQRLPAPNSNFRAQNIASPASAG